MTFFKFQRRTLPILLGWSLGSVIAGIFWSLDKNNVWRGIGSQFIVWGLIDGLIALLGLRGAKQNQLLVESGGMAQEDQLKKAKGFELFVWFNALLDVGYIFIGQWLVARNVRQDFKRGMGWGIVWQGLFLFVWDVFLAVFTRRRIRDG